MPTLRTLMTVLLVAIAAPAGAQTLTLSPAVVPLKGHPGQSTTQSLTVTNATRFELAFALEARDVVVRNGERVFVDAGELPGSIAATAVFSATTVVVPPGGSRTVDVTVTLTAGAGHRAMVALFRGTTPLPQGNATSTASLGTLLTFSISDHVSLTPSELKITPQSDSSNAAFEIALANEGEEPAVPQGVVVVLDASGRVMGKSPFETRRLLPGERATLRSEYSGELRAGTYRVIATFSYEGRSLTRAAELTIR
ncbi:MAG: hypothetical protein ACK4N5_08325 [Myxococcales bacterium]